MTVVVAVPEFAQIAEHVRSEWPGRGLPRGECYLVAEFIEARWPQLAVQAGFYLRRDGTPADHCWNVAPDGTIYDLTARQFGRVAHMVAPSSRSHRRYVPWEDEQRAQPLAHRVGFHDHDQVDVCPVCAAKTT